MQLSNIPSKFAIPFANGAGSGYIRTVPQASQIGITNGAASLQDGFPPLNFLPVGSGGVPPFGQDMNGILNQITLWSQWQSAGGLVPYDSAFSAAIGGYPKSALLAGTTAGQTWQSIVDNNTTNPNTGGAGWILLTTSAGVLNNQYSSAQDTGTAAALVVTLSPAPTAYTKFMGLEVQVANTATGPATINVNGLGAKPIVWSDQSAVSPSDWVANAIISLQYDGTSFQITGISPLAVQSGRWNYALAGGSTTALTATLSPAPTAIPIEFLLQTASAATGAATLNVNGLGAKTVTDANGAAITPGFWQAGNFLSIIYDGTNFRVVGGNRSITSPFTATNGATQALANGVLAQVNFASAGGSTSFGNYSTANFTFTRAGTYYVSGSVSTSLTLSGASNIAATAQVRQNGSAVPGIASGDGNYAPGATTTLSTQYFGGIVNVAVGDTISLYASSGAGANYTSSSVTSVLLAITLIS